MIIRRHRSACLLAVSVIITLLLIQTIWFSSQPQTSPKYDAKHIQLLRDYQARRSRKTNNVLVLSPNEAADHQLAPPASNSNKTFSLPPKQTNNTQSMVLQPESSHEHNRPTSLSDIFIAVKTTKKFHDTRVRLLLDTWIPLARQSVSYSAVFNTSVCGILFWMHGCWYRYGMYSVYSICAIYALMVIPNLNDCCG